MDDNPTKAPAGARREQEETAERDEIRRRGDAEHQAAHTAVGVLEGLSVAKVVEDQYSSLHKADEIAALLLKIVTVLALTFGLFEYDRQKADARVTQSLSLVQEWETGGYRAAFTNTNDRLWPLYSQSSDVIAAVGNDKDARALLYGNIGEAVTGRDDAFVSDADRDVDLVFHFFERAAICADEQICDYPVLKTFFGSEADSFWLYFSKYAERRQNDGYAGYGDWTRRFVEGQITPAKFLGLF